MKIQFTTHTLLVLMAVMLISCPTGFVEGKGIRGGDFDLATTHRRLKQKKKGKNNRDKSNAIDRTYAEEGTSSFWVKGHQPFVPGQSAPDMTTAAVTSVSVNQRPSTPTVTTSSNTGGGNVIVVTPPAAGDRTDNVGPSSSLVVELNPSVGGPHPDSAGGYNQGANGEEVGNAVVNGVKVTSSSGVVTHQTGTVDRVDTMPSGSYINTNYYGVTSAGKKKSNKKKGGKMRRTRANYLN